jgi:putative aldouronate transport system permease protein
MRMPRRAPKNILGRLAKDIRRNWILYAMIAPVVAYYVIFAYLPIYGIQIAFKDYNPKLGFWGSPWIGFEHFKRFFSGYNFGTLLKNTLGISFYSIIAGFPLPVVFALLVNYMPWKAFRKVIQMVSYAPNFISTVVMCGMLTVFLAPDTGIFNQAIKLFGGSSIPFLSAPGYFRSIYVWSGVWQSMGFSAVIYISALSGVDHEMHEAAIIDGATKIQRIRHIDVPSIMPTIATLLIFSLGGIMGVDFQKILLLQNPLNLPVSDVLSTYVYRVGLLNSDYGYSTAVGLFNSVCNVALLVSVNQVVKKLTSTGLW